MDKEIWKAFKNTHFGVSSWGRFFDFKKNIFIKPHLHKSRSAFYWRVSLSGKKYMAHVITATYFVPRLNFDAKQVEHDDNNTLNNNKNNLRWVTQSENQCLRYEKNKTPKLVE